MCYLIHNFLQNQLHFFNFNSILSCFLHVLEFQEFKMKQNNIDKLHSLKEISVRWGISVPMLKKLLSNGDISVVKIGVKNFIRESVIEKYIADNTIKAVGGEL